MSKLSYRTGLASMAALLALTACSTTPRLDRNFGNSVRAAVAAQTIDPAAVRNQDPVHGMDGRAALASQQRYVQSFQGKGQSAPAPLISGSAK